jgi:dihydroorotate dehydrogenase (NAD+) catalytic subunit
VSDERRDLAPLGVRVGPLALKNPVMVASGTFGNGPEVVPFVDPSYLGGFVTKSVTRRPREGNRPLRIVETAAGMLNSIGIMNPGIEAFLGRYLPLLARLETVRVVNLAGESVADFADLAARCDGREGIDALELNVSCPNVSGGLDFGTSPFLLESLVKTARAATRLPLIVKLTPNVTDITEVARAAENAGADALSLVNTYLGMSVDWRKRVPRLGSPTGSGGLSGPAIKPLALHAIAKVRRAVRLPLIGIGGIATVDDVLEFIVAGAAAVQVGTMNFVQPDTTRRIVDDLECLVARGEIPPIAELTGSLRIPAPEPGAPGGGPACGSRT